MRDDWNTSQCVGHGDSGFREAESHEPVNLWPRPLAGVRMTIPAHAVRVAPGTDAVVWKAWDTSHEVCEL